MNLKLLLHLENKIRVILASQVKRGNNENLKRIDDLIYSRNSYLGE